MDVTFVVVQIFLHFCIFLAGSFISGKFRPLTSVLVATLSALSGAAFSFVGLIMLKYDVNLTSGVLFIANGTSTVPLAVGIALIATLKEDRGDK